MKSFWRPLWLLLSMSVRVGPFASLACVVETAAQGLDLLQPVSLAWLVAGALRHDLSVVVLAAGTFIGSVTLYLVLLIIGNNARLLQVDRVGFAFDIRIARLTARIPTLDHLESPSYLDQLQTLRDQRGALGGALNMLLNTLNNLVSAGGALAVAAATDWRLLLVAVAGVPLVLTARWEIAWQAAAEQAAAPAGRLSGSLLALGVRPSPGAELRVFDLAGVLRERLASAVTAWRMPWVNLARREGRVESATSLLFFAVAGGVLAWMTGGALDGTVPLANLTLALLLIGRLQTSSNGLLSSVENLSQVLRTTRRYLWLVDYEHTARRDPGSARPPEVLQHGIRLERLTYRYGNTTALDDITLDLPAGTVVALVGENGAGKSTLVKLLAGLYHPNAGQILIDGTNLAAIDVEAWRQRLAGAFQDYAAFELSLLHSVGVGEVAYADDAGRVRQALRDGASEDLPAVVPDGLDTQLGASWPGGVDLSGGQWQRLALARAMMRDGPLLLILDEPTAALDATTEHELFERYAAAKRPGTVTLLVTHRFSTVAAADLVVVLDHGRVAEVGTHAELIAAGGRYAELYEIQARGYR